MKNKYVYIGIINYKFQMSVLNVYYRYTKQTIFLFFHKGVIMKLNVKTLLIGLGVFVFVAVAWFVGIYNGLVAQAQEIDAQWGQVETQYQRRYDLIPNLVESTKGFMEQEKEVFDNLAKARQNYAGANTPNEKAQAAGELESALSRLLVIVENYPELKSNETVLALMDELAGTENRISVERKRYNDTVKPYNTKVKTFPTVLIAGMFGFNERAYFEAVAEADQAPEVSFE